MMAMGALGATLCDAPPPASPNSSDGLFRPAAVAGEPVGIRGRRRGADRGRTWALAWWLES
jgi:hypothetical protein